VDWGQGRRKRKGTVEGCSEPGRGRRKKNTRTYIRLTFGGLTLITLVVSLRSKFVMTSCIII
jgi:hypothetical protein